MEQLNWSDKVKLGQFTLKNRVVLSALTRQRCDAQDGIPTDVVRQYYEQRSGAGLLLTECVAWTQRGESFPGAANLFTKEQMEGWKKVVDAVHQKGALLFVQIFHGGRSSLTQTTRGLKPQAPSPIAIRDMHYTFKKDHQVPEEMTLDDIEVTKKEFRKSVELAQEAGFDGVELHGAHGYLIDEFLKSWSNKRTDNYGGSAENRCRFALQLVDIALQVFKPWQVGIKISPCSRYNDQYDDNPAETYIHLVKELNKKNIGFVEVRESTEAVSERHKFPTLPKEQIPDICKLLRPHFEGILIGNDQFTEVTGIQKIRAGLSDLISFGTKYVCNPDLAERILNKQEINKTVDWRTCFRGQNFENLGPKGYTDYPNYEQSQRQKESQKIQEK